MKNLCLAGGVALNCVANGRLLREGPFERSGSSRQRATRAGRSARRSRWHEYLTSRGTSERPTDAMQGATSGPRFRRRRGRAPISTRRAPRTQVCPTIELFPRVARLLADEKVVGWFQGRMEFGPRALGARSIIGDARSLKMQSVMNLKIKFRESFRPFAPSVLAERVGDYFELDGESPYMLHRRPVRKEPENPLPPNRTAFFGIDKLKSPRSDLPAITHVDYSARVQTVHARN